MPFTVHGDMFYTYDAPHFLSHGEWDAYGIAAEKNSNYYPPFAMIFFAFVQLIFRQFLPGFEQFTHNLGFLEIKAVYESEHLYLSLFLMKLPYLFFDCLIFLTCWKMLPNDKSKLNFTVFWAVNPIVIYGTYMFGQFDLIPSFFVVLACYLSLQKGKEHYACLSIAAGCLFKLFPIIFLPMVLLISSRNAKDFIRLFLYGITPILFFYGIFYLISGEAVLKLFSAISHSTKFAIDFKVLALRFLQAAIYLLICFHILYYAREESSYALLAQYFLAIYLSIYWGLHIAFTHYFVWVIPFMILYVHQRSKWKKLFYFLLALIFIAGLKPRAGCLGIFAPINPELFLSLPSLKDVTGFIFDQKAYETVVSVLFKVTTGLWVLQIIKNLYKPSHTA